MSTQTTPAESTASGRTLLHGVDLVQIPRFRDVFRRHPAFAQRVFTADERAACDRRPDPVQHYAARFAAKEAAFKALGVGVHSIGIDRRWQEAEVVRSDGPPTLRLHGSLARAAERQGVVESALSLSHDGPGAIASVIMRAEGSAT